MNPQSTTGTPPEKAATAAALPSEKPQSSTGDRKLAKAFGLEGDGWMKHANPVSVWTQVQRLVLVRPGDLVP